MSAAEIDALLADFRAWLEAGGEAAPEPVGLLTLAREFTALRHEVNLQTKATRAAVEKLSEPAPPTDLREAQRPLAETLADIADVLRTSVDRIRDTTETLKLYEPEDMPKPSPTGWFNKLFQFRPTRSALQDWAEATESRVATSHILLNPALRAVADGYALSLKRVERAMTAVGLEPIPAIGERFDPTTMEAVELADGGDAASGTVLSESRRGYRWGGEVFRFARVTVAR